MLQKLHCGTPASECTYSEMFRCQGPRCTSAAAAVTWELPEAQLVKEAV